MTESWEGMGRFQEEFIGTSSWPSFCIGEIYITGWGRWQSAQWYEKGLITSTGPDTKLKPAETRQGKQGLSNKIATTRENSSNSSNITLMQGFVLK